VGARDAVGRSCSSAAPGPAIVSAAAGRPVNFPYAEIANAAAPSWRTPTKVISPRSSASRLGGVVVVGSLVPGSVSVALVGLGSARRRQQHRCTACKDSLQDMPLVHGRSIG
jgi:hypothetical protein